MSYIDIDFIHHVLCKAFDYTRFSRNDSKVIFITEVTQCLRYSYFYRVEPVCSPAVVAILLGALGHRMLKDVLEEYGFVVEKRVEYRSNGIVLRGSVDAYHPDLNLVLEFKFVEEPPEKPYDEHVFQTRIYMSLVNARNGYVVYVPRKPGRSVKLFRVTPSSKALRLAIERARRLADALERNEPPEPERSHLCSYCPYRFKCFRLRKASRR